MTDISSPSNLRVWVFSTQRFSTLNTSVIRSLLGRVVASSTPVSFMTRASKAKAGGKKSQGRHNAFSGAKLEFLVSFKDQFINSTDRSGFYTKVTQGFTQQFGYDLAIEANPGPDDADDKHTPKDIDPLLPLAEQNKESNRRNKCYHELHKVSHLLHKCEVEPDNLCY